MDTHFVNRDYQGAVNELVRLVKLHPNNEGLLNKLSVVAATIGRADLVRRATAQAVKLAPLSINAWVNRVGNGFLMFGPVADAREAMDEMSRLGFSVPTLSAQLK